MRFILNILSSIGKNNKSGSPSAIMIANLISLLIFMCFVPALMFFLGNKIITLTGDIKIPYFEHSLNVLLIIIGFIIRAWASWTHYKIGSGSPLYTNPSKKLIVKGPYKYTRNPIMLGMMFFYLGLSMFFYSLIQFLIIFVIPVIFGNCYHKFVEEKELVLKFGTEYEDYRKQVPFLIPFLRIKNNLKT